MNAKTTNQQKSTSPAVPPVEKLQSKAVSFWFDTQFHAALKARAAAKGVSMSKHLKILAQRDIRQWESKKLKSKKA